MCTSSLRPMQSFLGTSIHQSSGVCIPFAARSSDAYLFSALVSFCSVFCRSSLGPIITYLTYVCQPYIITLLLYKLKYIFFKKLYSIPSICILAEKSYFKFLHEVHRNMFLQKLMHFSPKPIFTAYLYILMHRGNSTERKDKAYSEFDLTYFPHFFSILHP
jgi:hypothetical protein